MSHDDIEAAIMHDRAFGWGMRLALNMAAAGADERAREYADRLIAEALRARASLKRRYQPDQSYQCLSP